MLGATGASAEKPKFLNPEQEAYIHRGVEKMIRMEFDASRKEFEVLEKMVPGHPHPYFGYASVAWLRFIYESEQSDQALLKPFHEAIEKGIDVSDAWVKLHPEDAEGWMTRGALHGLYARLLMTRHRYIKGYFTARTSMKSVRRALKIDPELMDAKLGIGMYDYYTDVYPHFVGVLAKLVLRGDRERGIALINEVAEKGRFSKWTAKMALVEIYTHDMWGAKDPERAVEIMAEVREAFPNSSMLHSAELCAKLYANHYAEVEVDAVKFIKRVDSGEYLALEKAKGLLILGHAQWFLGKPTLALKSFREAALIKMKGQLSRYAVASLIRAGNVLDTMGKREDAMALYKQAKGQPDHWGFKKVAALHLSKPFILPTLPFIITPHDF